MGRIRQTYRKYTIRKSKLRKQARKRSNPKRCSKCGRFM